jgi:hypothetical protein
MNATRRWALPSKRSVQIATAAWVAGVILVATSVSTLPFNWGQMAMPGMASMTNMSVGYQLISANTQILFALMLIGVTVLVTRKRRVVDIADRAPSFRQSRTEMGWLVGYAVAVQLIGLGLGHIVGGYAISLHLPGTVFGINAAVAPKVVCAWVAYNFVAYAALPYLYFRARGYSNDALSLRSADRRKDVVLISIVLVLESAFELGFAHNIFGLSGRQLLTGIPLTFVIYMLGTSLPIMIFIYALLLPRYLKLTGSVATTVILGGVTYAALHLFEAWTLWDSATNISLSLTFLMFQYFGPGMVKAILTIRTGNAWVHVAAYHSLAPHVWLDTPLIVRIFKIT